MINSSTAFHFNEESSDDYGVLNVTLNNDFYSNSLIGERSIIEEKIQGRDNPYLYDVDSAPLEFEMTIALENYSTVEEINSLIEWLYGPKTYKLLYFDDNPNLHFFGIFIGSPVFNYVGANKLGYKKYIGYITTRVRLNAPYGYTPLEKYMDQTDDFEVDHSGNLTTYPSFGIINMSSEINTVTLTNSLNDSTFSYTLSPNETLSFNGYTKNLSSNYIDPIEGSKNPYGSWYQDYLTIDPGEPTIKIASDSSVSVDLSFRAPKFI